MSLLSDYRAKFPIYKDVSDDDLATALHSKYYSDIPYDEFSAKVGLAKVEAAPVVEDKGYFEKLTDTVKDVGTGVMRKTVEAGRFGLDRANDAVQGSIAVPEAVVGLADIPTGGRVGKALEDAGYRPDQAKQFLTEQFSDEQKAANQAVSDADGFVDKATAAIQNPRSIVSAVTQSAPLMGAGGVIGRGAVAFGANPVIAGAIGEGVLGAGSAAEGTRQQTKDGLLTNKQSGLAVASGLGTALTSVIGGKLAEKLGIVDIDTVIAGGVTTEVKKSLAKRLILGGISEGVFEEMPQSAQEQILSNIALDKPLTEGVDEAAAMGLLSGAAMGGGASAILGGKDKTPSGETNPAQPDNGQLLTISQGNPADDLLAAQKSADYDAQQRQAASDLAVTKVTDEANTIDDAIQLAETAIDTPLVAPSGLLGSATQPDDIYADDILGDSNVSNTNDAVTAMAAAASDVASDNVQGSVDDLSLQSDGRGLDNSTETLTQSLGSDQPIGNASRGNNAVADRPFAQATDDFLPQMRSMTTDAKVISQIDAELALRGIANVDTVNTTQERVDETEKGVQVNDVAPVADTTTVPVAESPSPASWVIRNKETGEPIMETFQKSVADKANKEKYEVVPILQHLQELNEEGSKARNYAQRDTSTPIAEPEAVKATDPVKKAAKPKAAKAPKTKSLLAVLRDLGGVAMSEKLDITGEERGFAAGGYNQIFKKSSTRSLKGLIESGDLDEYLPYNMRLEANGMNDDAFDSTEAYDYLADKIRGGEGVLPYAVEEELRALQYESNAAEDAANELTEDEINEQFTIAANEERESTTNARVFNTESENGSTGRGESNTDAAETDTNEQAESLELTGQTNDEINAGIAAQEAEAKAKTEAEKADAAAKVEAERKARQAIAADSFDLTQTGKDAKTTKDNDAKVIDNQFAGQGDLLTAPNAESNQDEVIYNGIRLYKLKVRNRVEGQPPTEMWAVESLENKSRKERGERAIGGDALSESLDEAKAEADLMLKRDAEKNQSAEAQAKREAEQQEQSRIEADKKSDIDGFGAELNAMQLGKLKETLNKQTSIKGEVAPLRDTVRKLVAQGGKPEIKEENVYKGMSRAQYNRADNRAQQEDEKRIREGGKKNVYYITMPDGGMYELGKTAHDFAEHLISKKNSDVTETNFGNTQPEAKSQAKEDLDAALGDLGNIFGKTYRADITPEQEQKIIPVLTRVFDAAFRLGYYEFKAAAKFVMDTIRTKIGSDVADLVTLDYLQGAYISMAGKYKDQATSKKDVVNVESLEELQGNSNVTNERSSTDLERDSGNAGTSNEVGEESVQDGRAGNGRTGRSGIQGTETESGSGSSEIVPNSETISIGEQSNIEVQTGQTPSDASIARDSINRGSGDSGLTGQPIEPEAAERIDEVAQGGLFEVEARRDQKAADAIPQELSIENIRETLPILKTGQQEDVLKAETRFAEPEGYGMLFTNGTGTGKTFTGLGIIKRFANRGKTNVLVVAPNDKIIEDWQKSGKLLGLNLNRLDSTTDSGTGIIITTYANMGANQSLADRNWDLVVHDEAHYLAMDKDGTNTNALKTLRAITKHPDGAYLRHQMMYRAEYAKQSAIRDQLQVTIDKGRSNLLSDKEAEANDKENDRLSLLLDEVNESLRVTNKIVQEEVKESQGLERPRALFLSATPFAYEKTVDWANGYLFDYNEGQSSDQTESRGYNSGSNRERFMMQQFGYRMRYNKLTAPDAKVNSGLMQRQFNTFLKKKGSLSGRMLDVDADYDRKFILVDSAIGARIDEALQWFEEKRKAIGESPLGTKDPRKAALYDVQKLISEKFDYLSRRYLLESIKAREVITHVKEHMAIGRKVVVFHDYKKGGGFNPFDLQEFSPSDLPDTQAKIEDINQVIQEFRAEFKDLINSPEFKSTSPIDAFKKEFPSVLLFNGDVPAKKRRENVATFNDDNNGPQVILVQSAAGKEGISLHDTTGKHQRVLFNLGQPTQPTTSIQQEGRIYRTGQVTDAIFRYLNTGTNWERWAFARDVANRASAAENLALGEQARALKDAFISAFEESDDYRAGMELEGKGGKERDKAANEALTEYDRAKAFYYGTQKKTSKTKAQEGADYFATPEPVGLKMIELADIRAGEKVLEPSAGHGAIARWMPEGSEKFAIEPSSALRPRLAMVFDGNIISSDFEDLNIVNKFDAIVMNPPFGSAGRTAIDHVIKASNHLKDGGRIVALIPVGSTDKKFDKWFYETETRPLKPIFEKDNIKVFAGDTVVMEGFNNTFEIKDVVIDTMAGGTQYFRTKGQSKESGIIANAVKSVKPVGARTEEYSPAKGLSLVAEIKMPAVTFERAGTAVNTRIVVIEKSDNAPQQTNRDYTQVTDINDLFDRMETLSIPERSVANNQDAAVTETKPAAQTKPALESVSGDFDIKTAQFEHSRTKDTMYVAALGKRLELEDYNKVNAIAKANGGYYSSFKGAGAIQGFLFKSEEARQAFISALNQDRGDTPKFSRSNATKDIPDAIILNELGSAKNSNDYELAKSGDVEAATRLAKLLVTDDVINQLKSLANETDLIAGVTSIESTGNNALPEAAALLISEKLGVPYDENIVQSSSPKRTNMNGLDRIFNRPLFQGDVIDGAGYIFVDDTITQGGTFAALSAHVKDGGGNVVANIALTGKQYSSKIALSDDALTKVREKFGDLENEFKQATGYGYDGLTASEARYLTSGISLEQFRNRITEESQKTASDTNSQASQRNGLDTPSFSNNNQFSPLVANDRLQLTKSKDQSSANALNRVMVGYFDDNWSNAYEQTDLPDSLANFAEAAEVAYGTKITAVRPTGRKFNIFNGINVGKTNYINIESEVSFINITGHEIYHDIERNRPDLHEWLKEQASNHYQDFYVYKDKLNALVQKGETKYNNSKAQSELLADLMGDAMADPVFVGELAKANPSKFKQLLKYVTQWLGDVANKLKKKDLGSSQYFDDVEAMRRHLNKVITAYSMGKTIEEIQAMQAPKFHRAFHGSPHDHDKFEMSKVGTGEGNQSYGYGLYFAGRKSVAEWYKDKLSNVTYKLKNGDVVSLQYLMDKTGWKSYVDGNFERILNLWNDKDNLNGIRGESKGRDALKWLNNNLDSLVKSGKLYEVELAPKEDEYLLWDKPLSEQSNTVIAALEKKFSLASFNQDFATAGEFYNSRARKFDSQEKASAELNSLGIRGIKYLDGTSRSEGEGSYNYVIFNEDDISIEAKFSRTQYVGGNLEPEAETRTEALQRAIQDQFAIFKRTQEKLLANGGVVGDRENVYEAMMRYPARFRNKVTDFMRGTFDPIVDRIGKIDTSFNELGRYMLALHAKEGNAYIQTINEDADAGVGMTNAEAAKVIKEAEARTDFAEFDSIARDLQNITNMRLNMLVTAGVYSSEQADAMRKQYQFYVPVKGFADLEVDDLPAQFTGSGFSTTKKLDMRRKGRKSEPSQIVENIIRDYQVAVAAVEKANVGRYLRNLVAVNPNSSLWTLEEAPTQKVIEQDKRIWAVMDGNNEVGRFTTKREASTTAALLNKGSSKNAQVVQVAPKETVVNRPIAYDREQEVRFIENGKEYRIQLKDPLMAASYNSLNKVVTNNMLVRGADNILTFFREMWTQKSPVFIVLNGFLRDPQSALAVGVPLRGLSWTKKMYGNYASAAKALYQFETESEITNERMRKHLENYRKNGGGIGYAYVGDIDQTQSELNKALRIASGNMNLADRAYNNQVIKSIEVLNAVGENALRLSAYIADVESGRSILDAVKMSKEITVNFNRKGEMSAGIGRIFLFANSNIQGINNLIVQPIKQNPKVAAATFGSFIATGFALGMIEALLNSGDDDEEKDDLFEENSRMMSLRIGDMQIKLDNAYGVGWFVYLGRMIARTVLRPETAGSNALNVASAFFDHFSFMGNPIPNEQDLSAKRAIGGTAPTLIAPFVYALLNTSRFGNDLYPDYDGGSSPDAYRSWKGTKNSLYADAAIFLNESTGGNVVESGMIDVSPETLKMLTNYGLGGVGTFFGNTGSSVSNLIDGEIDSQNIPFVNRWYDPLDVQNYQRRFYNEAGKARQFKDQVNKLYKAGLTERSDELLSKNEALYAAGLEAQSIWTYVNSLREAENFIKQDKTLSKSEKKEMLELNHKERIEIMKMYHNEYIMKVGE